MNLREKIAEIVKLGYNTADARARICQDIVLKAIANSTFSRNATIKGGVVMRSITENTRRATQDMDIDFIRYSLSDDAIDIFLDRINCIDGIKIVRTGIIQELSQQDYKGKRVIVKISDDYGNSIESKIDLGVHKHLEIEQEEYCFDIAFDNEGASLLINSKEQMFAEKLRSLLKFGEFSTRYKDIYDMYYYCDKLDMSKLIHCFNIYIFEDPGMRENDVKAVVDRVKSVFANVEYRVRADKTDKRWLDEDIEVIFGGIIMFLEEVNKTTYPC